MKKAILALGLLTLVASGCATNTVQKSGNDDLKIHDLTQINNDGAAQLDLKKVNLAIARLNAEINELDELQTSVYAKSLTPDAKVQKALDAKVEEYGSIETLQANIRVLIALKQANEPLPIQHLETAANKSK